MVNTLRAAADAWISRAARPESAALAAVAGLSPATVVTGASRGIGLALARRFAEAGSNVALVAREQAPLEAAAASIAQDFNVRAIPIAADVTAPDAPQTIDRTLAGHGLYADVLVNNAGLGLSGAFHDEPASDIDRMLALNVTALTRLMHHAAGEMRARGRGGILNVASLGGYVPGPYQAAYYASKAYVISLTEAVAHELRGQGVRIAVVAPGPVETGFHHAMGAESSLYRILVPSLTPEHVARSAYRGFAIGRRVIVPGLLPSLTSWLVRILPHPLTVPIVGALLAPPADDPAGKPKIDARRDD